MKAIHIKLIRDLAYLKGQAIAIALVMACGVATFIMSVSTLDSLTRTLDAYYQQNRFAHVFAHLKRAPRHLAARIGEIPGVAHVQTRVVERILLDMPGMTEPASGRIVSLTGDPSEGLNLLHLRIGRFPEGQAREVLVSQRFAEAHGLHPGDTVPAVLNGRLEHLRVVGIALTPEYVYLINPGGLLPEEERFGVFWMGRDEMEAAFDMEGAFNDVTLTLKPGASAPEIIARLDELTERYGGLGAYERKDQASHKILENEIRELRGQTLVVPIIFLGVAAFLLNIVLSRIIATQREQIAAMKAMGYTRREIGTHYLGFVMLITLLAVIFGSLVGAFMGRGLTALYIEFFDFPSFGYVLRGRVIMLALLVSAGAATFGVLRALYSAMRLPPAEAMRPQAPASFHPTVLERMGLHFALPVWVRMIFRQLERHPIKTGLSTFGIALATAIVIVGSFTRDSMDYLLNFQFNRVQRYDVDVVLTDQTDQSALSVIRHMPSVRRIEPYRTLAVRIGNRHVERRTSIIGLANDDGLYRLLDMSGEKVMLPENGIVLSTVLAELLSVGVGDDIFIEALEGRRPEFSIEVSGLIEDFSGLAAYMSLPELNRVMREQNQIGGVYLATDPLQLASLYEKLHEAPRVVAVNVKSATAENFRDTIARNISLTHPFLITFSVIIAFGVVYNNARISLSERSRDLATLRVLGFTHREIAMIQLGELTIVTGLAIPLGMALGYALAWLTSRAFTSELIRIPFIVYPSTFTLGAVVVAAASLLSGVMVQRRLTKLDLIAVLKAQE